MSTLPNLPPSDSPARRPRWQRVLLWSAVTLICLAALLVAGVSVLLHSQRLHNLVLDRARQNIAESLGVPVEIGNYSLNFSGISPTLDVYGLVVHGAPPFSDTPLLQLEHGRIRVHVISLLRRQWYLDELSLHHAVAQIRVDAQGNSNLPKPQQPSSGNGVQQIFDLGIRHAVLDQSAVYYNDRLNSLTADLQNVTLNAIYNQARNAYAGQIGYTGGQLQSGSYAPIPHTLHAEFEMTPTHLDVRKAELHSQSSVIDFSGTLDDFSNPRIAASYHASLNVTELRRPLRIASLPTGVIVVDGQAQYSAQAGQSTLNALNLRGTLHSDRLDFLIPGSSKQPPTHADAFAIRASYSLANGNAELRSVTASLFGGTAVAEATVRNLAAQQEGVVRLRLDGISLVPLKQLAGLDTGEMTLTGTVSATGNAQWKGSPENLTATGDATLNASAGSAQSAAIPILGEVHADYRNRNQQLTLRQSSLHTPQTTLTLDGTTDGHSQIHLNLNAHDLHEVETIASIFSHPAQPLDLHGSAAFQGTLSGPTSALMLSGNLSGTNLHVRGSEWRQLRAHIDASPNMIDIRDGHLVPAANGAQGAIAFSGSAQLKQWTFTENSPIQLSLNGQGLDVEQLAHLAGSTTPVTGRVNVHLQAHGSALNPIGQGRVELLKASISGEPVTSATAQFQGDGRAVHATLNISMPAGATAGSLVYYPEQRGYEVELQTENFKLNQLQTVKARNLPVNGMMNVKASGRGTLDDPQLTASVDIPQLTAQGEHLDHFALRAEVTHHVANLTLETNAVNATVKGHATVQLTGDYQADAALDSTPIPIQPLLATYMPEQAQDVSGQTELHATLHGPLKQRERIEAHVLIPQLNLKYQNSVALAATAPIRADYANGVLTLQRSGLKGTGTDLQFEGAVPVLDRFRPVQLVLLGTVDLHLMQIIDPEITSAGQLRFNINTVGSSSDPNVEGEVRIENASLTLPDAPISLSNGNGTLTLTRDRLNISSFQGTMGGGKVTMRGGIAYRPSLQFDVLLSGQGIRLLYPEGVRQNLSANLTLAGTPEKAQLRGQVNVDQLSFTPDFELSSLTDLTNSVQQPPSHGLASNVAMNVSVRSSQNVNLVSRTMSLNGTANLRVAGTLDDPVVLGRITMTGGDLLFQGNRYLLQSGVIDFVNPSRTVPNINASITTTIQQYNIGMRVEGTLDHLRTNYTSDPALPPADIINLLAFGKTQEASAASGTTNTLSAEQTIASAVSGQVTGRIEKFTGISHLSVDPTLGSNQQTTATITIQQRVTGKIFVTFSTDLTGTEKQVIQLQYQATPKVSLSGTRDQNGGFGFDTRITRDW